MSQPRLAYAGVVELPQEVCQLPWTDEETLEQENIACDDPPIEEEEDSKEELSVSDFISSPVVVDDANDMNKGNDGNGRMEVKTTSRFNSGPDIAICFFQVEENEQEDMNPDNHDENQDKAWLEHGTELTEHAFGIDAKKLSSTLGEQQGVSTLSGNKYS